MTVRIIQGDCRDVLKTLPDESVHCVVTSPPYFGLRDYGVAGQIGMEPDPSAFVAEMVAVFAEVRRVLRDDGTLWLNLGDSYAGSGRGGNPDAGTKQGTNKGSQSIGVLYGRDENGRDMERQRIKALNSSILASGVKPKDLIGIPWRVAFALQQDGWYLRQRMPWVKRNPMPESTTDRPTSAVEEVFLFSKSRHYFYDYASVKRTMAPSSVGHLAQDIESQGGSNRANGGRKTNGRMKAVSGDKKRGHSRRHAGFNDRWNKMERNEQCGARAFRNTDLFFTSLTAPHGAIGNESEIIALDVATHSFREAHFATFPPALIEPCIKAGCPIGGTVLDPFGGAGTTGMVADRLDRHAILIELNPRYTAMAERRIKQDGGIFAEVTA